MRIRAGYDLVFECPNSTPMILCLSVHPSRRKDLVSPDVPVFSPAIASTTYIDGFGNLCTRIVAPAGQTQIAARFEIQDSGLPDPVARDAAQVPVEALPDDVLVYLLGSRYCDTDRLGDFAWQTFSATPAGWDRVQAICDFVHGHIRFDYQQADRTRAASDGLRQGVGVCRDFAHLAIALCRCMNIPARYCTGYLGDIGVAPLPDPMDFSAWFEVWLGGRWYAFDARHNRPRIGRVLIATGRDATDVAISTSFGSSSLVKFEVVTDEVALV